MRTGLCVVMVVGVGLGVKAEMQSGGFDRLALGKPTGGNTTDDITTSVTGHQFTVGCQPGDRGGHPVYWKGKSVVHLLWATGCQPCGGNHRAGTRGGQPGYYTPCWD